MCWWSDFIALIKKGDVIENRCEAWYIGRWVRIDNGWQCVSDGNRVGIWEPSKSNSSTRKFHADEIFITFALEVVTSPVVQPVTIISRFNDIHFPFHVTYITSLVYDTGNQSLSVSRRLPLEDRPVHIYWRLISKPVTKVVDLQTTNNIAL